MKQLQRTMTTTIIALTIAPLATTRVLANHDGYHGMMWGTGSGWWLGSWLMLFTWLAFLVFLILGIIYFAKKLFDED